jgi:uncharacterized protein (DUF1501 family)
MSCRSVVSPGCPEYGVLDSWSRREFLRVGALSAFGLSLPQLFRAEAQASAYGETVRPRAKACILVFLSGGPSHYETFDPKPEAPTEYRTIFGVVQTPIPGVYLCEHLSRLARLANRFALVRSMSHKFTGHFGGHRYVLTGHFAPGNPDQPARPDDKPGLASLAAKFLARRNIAMPPTFMLPWVATDQGSGASGGMLAGTLGKQCDPVVIEADMNSLKDPNQPPVFRVPEFALQPDVTPQRLTERRSLLQIVDQARQELAQQAALADMDTFYRKAFELLTSNQIREAFDLDKEPAKLREEYGLNAFGQSCLLARRLIERQARFVQINFSRNVTQDRYGWDTHNKGRETLKDHLLPKLDAGLSTLLTDLESRGLLQETLVVAMGEFGRTPRVKPDGGRDHWPQCYSILLAGGGIHGGLVYGSSDKHGAYPASDPVEPRQIILTVLTLLGIPTAMPDPQGRVVPLFDGYHPVERLYS